MAEANRSKPSATAKGAGTLSEDVQDDGFAIYDVHTKDLLQVALLARRQFMVEDRDIDVHGLDDARQLFGLSLAHQQRRIELVATLQLELHRVGPGGVDEQRELLEARLRRR